MAVRKKPETRYLKDSSHSDPTILRDAELEIEQFCTVIRVLLKSGIGPSEVLIAVIDKVFEEFGLKAEGTPATKIPKQGSDQVNMGSIVTWIKSVKSKDETAIEQLQIIRATAASRLT